MNRIKIDFRVVSIVLVDDNKFFCYIQEDGSVPALSGKLKLSTFRL